MRARADAEERRGKKNRIRLQNRSVKYAFRRPQNRAAYTSVIVSLLLPARDSNRFHALVRSKDVRPFVLRVAPPLPPPRKQRRPQIILDRFHNLTVRWARCFLDDDCRHPHCKPVVPERTNGPRHVARPWKGPCRRNGHRRNHLSEVGSGRYF